MDEIDRKLAEQERQNRADPKLAHVYELIDKEKREQRIGLFGIVVILGAMAYWAHSGLDSIGWIPHTEESTITVQSDWLVGESKSCTSIPLNAQTATNIKKNVGDSFTKIYCDGGPDHQIEVTFYGKKEQPERNGVMWRCTRNSRTFTCLQIGTW